MIPKFVVKKRVCPLLVLFLLTSVAFCDDSALPRSSKRVTFNFSNGFMHPVYHYDRKKDPGSRGVGGKVWGKILQLGREGRERIRFRRIAVATTLVVGSKKLLPPPSQVLSDYYLGYTLRTSTTHYNTLLTSMTANLTLIISWTSRILLSVAFRMLLTWAYMSSYDTGDASKIAVTLLLYVLSVGCLGNVLLMFLAGTLYYKDELAAGAAAGAAEGAAGVKRASGYGAVGEQSGDEDSLWDRIMYYSISASGDDGGSGSRTENDTKWSMLDVLRGSDRPRMRRRAGSKLPIAARPLSKRLKTANAFVLALKVAYVMYSLKRAFLLPGSSPAQTLPYLSVLVLSRASLSTSSFHFALTNAYSFLISVAYLSKHDSKAYLAVGAADLALALWPFFL